MLKLEFLKVRTFKNTYFLTIYVTVQQEHYIFLHTFIAFNVAIWKKNRSTRRKTLKAQEISTMGTLRGTGGREKRVKPAWRGITSRIYSTKSTQSAWGPRMRGNPANLAIYHYSQSSITL